MTRAQQGQTRNAGGDERPSGPLGPAAAALGGAPGAVGWLLKPLLLVLGVFSTAKSFKRSPVIGHPRLNALGLHVLRAAFAHLIMGLRMRLFAFPVPAADRETFLRDGILVKPDFLPPDAFRRIRDEALEYDGRIREFVEGEAVTRRAFFDDAAGAPGFLALERHLPLTRLMAMASGGTPPVWSVERIAPGPGDPQTELHSDTFHPSAKCWLYLHDVGADEGPFVYTPGSHRLNWRRVKWEYRRSCVARDLQDGHSEHGSFRAYAMDIEELGLDPPRPYPVRANTLVVANTYGFHCRRPGPPSQARTAAHAFARGNPFLPIALPPVGVAVAPLRWARRRYFAWLDREIGAGRVAGRSVYDGRIDR